ncbi:MAG: class I SAM-dependent rRNA methyltransferase [Deltaproteobacteria bacterium]|nr:class I SAM-dependent rRNA methyltransferase [Deltaproteobacteria bacterium]
MNDLLSSRLARAIERRDPLVQELGSDTSALRLVHGSGDGIEGLTADRLGPAILVERHRRSAPAEELVSELVRRLAADPVFLKERWSRDPAQLAGKQVGGPSMNVDELVVRELGLSFAVRLVAGEHVGLFLDSRPARALVRQLAVGRRVLNLFSYTGGFGVVAASGNARSTTNVDSKPSAHDAARHNYLLNDLPFDTRTFLKDDVIRHLNRAARGCGRYDLIVLDPPPRFDRAGGGTYRAREGYGRLVTRCLRVISADGLLLAGSNAFGRDAGELERVVLESTAEVGATVEVVERVFPGPDFPPAPERPTCMCVLLRVVRPGTGR